MQDLWGVLLIVGAALTMIVGNLIAIPQRNVRRLLAGSGIAHVGYLLLAFALGSVEGLAMLLFYLAAYVFTNGGAFIVQCVMGAQGPEGDDVGAYKGLAARAPALALAMLLFLLSLGGIPFVAGFWAKFQVFMAAWHGGHPLMVVLGAALAVLALFYYLRIARAMYVDAPEGGAPTHLLPMGLPTRIAIAVALIGVVGMGLYPRPFVEAAFEAARGLLGG
jgi:NADH-quinone oxidoreductase subunit N